MAFEDVVGYFIIFIVFIVGFLPILVDFVTVAQATTTNPNTIMILSILIPFILIVMVVGFFIRLQGRQPFGEF